MTEQAKQLVEQWLNKPMQIIKPSTIKISKEYKDFNGNLWLGREIEVAPTESITEAYRKAEQEMDSYFHSRGQLPLTDFNTGQQSSGSYRVYESDKPIPTTHIDKEEKNDQIIEEINQCGTLDQLSSYRFVKEWHPKIKEAYNKRLNELQSK